ncbi:DUF2938 domain-containing protein [Ectopseudomonas mendocina]|uniref:DUF2938 domain-containing protein n=1 Tax=Ectopseudomonas mendocina TaxID=300 RepID=A0ABZ2RKS1_ECTME
MKVELLLQVLVLGVGATWFMDMWALLRWRLFNVPSLDYALVGRWIGHMPRGVFYHPNIGKAAAINGEKWMGWVFHYLTGVAFAGLFVVLTSPQWLARPTLVPALLFGGFTVLIPWLVMQPAFGLGLAASNLPKPWQARSRSLVTHLVFGLGLYLVAVFVAAAWT